ncbi:hypothetical protein KO481_18630 [Nocardia sp. NEAU-G5]|uniref:DoxX family protein n=1 Tax=Nocardia albiluteola TaxID=2842303 RepID=A0ABS6B1B6_9NOCA|nr:hypothetical protein [Nocardia albiluteola]MBU3063541.1 hypothetical protein [Nocardia albiluteola]
MNPESSARHRRIYLLTALLFGVGTTHFVIPEQYDKIVPPALPGEARTYTYVSGVAELIVAAALSFPRTRRLGGLFAALLFVAVFPANVQMAADALRNPKAPLPLKVISVLRLPLQVPLVTTALKISRAA